MGVVSAPTGVMEATVVEVVVAAVSTHVVTPVISHVNVPISTVVVDPVVVVVVAVSATIVVVMVISLEAAQSRQIVGATDVVKVDTCSESVLQLNNVSLMMKESS